MSEASNGAGGRPAIELRDIGKRYWQLEDRAMLLKSVMPFLGPRRTERWALRHLDLDVAPGETIGIIGRNGAGKTTMLRLLAGVSRPSEGRLTIRGRVAPLIGVGVGFHQEMSGRENVYVNGMLLGLTQAQVRRRFDEIVAFSELERFIDTPVKFYSSGMFMRLGFAVAANVEPSVLLVDEVLAVGDLAFQLKCFDRMRDLQRNGTTIVFVSHSLHAIRLLCPRVALIRSGVLEYDGDPEMAITRYHRLMSDRVTDPSTDTEMPVMIDRRELVGPHGPTHVLGQDEAAVYEARLTFREDIDHPQVFFYVLTEDGTLAYSMHSTVGSEWRRFSAGEEAVVRVGFRSHLAGGTYRLVLVVTDTRGVDHFTHDEDGLLVYLAPRFGSAGVADLRATILVDGDDRSDHKPLLLGNGSSSAGSLGEDRAR